MTTTTRLDIDWNDDGDYSDSTEALIGRVFARPGIVATRGRDQIRVLAPPAAGHLSATVDNRDKALSPEYASSPIASYLRPGHAMRLVRIGSGIQYNQALIRYNEPGIPYNGDQYDLWHGQLDDIGISPGIGDQSASIPGIGYLARFAGKLVSTALYQSIRTDQAIGYILDAAGWSSSARRISTGNTTLQWFWADNQDALSLMLQVLAAEGVGASLYEGHDGAIVFENRYYRSLIARCLSPQWTFSPVSTEPVLQVGYKYNPNFKNIVNKASVTVKTRAAAGSLSAVWSLGSSLTLGADETRSITARQSSGVPFTGAITPVLTTDYTLSAGSVSSISLDRTSGASVTISITAGALGATLSSLQLRAYLVDTAATTTVSHSVDTSTSQTRYGIQPFSLSLWPELSVNDAQDILNGIVTNYKEPRPTLELRLVADDTAATRLRAALGAQISDRILISNADGAGTDVEAFIERLEYRLTDAGTHELIIGAEKITAAVSDLALWDFAIWGDAVWGY